MVTLIGSSSPFLTRKDRRRAVAATPTALSQQSCDVRPPKVSPYLSVQLHGPMGTDRLPQGMFARTRVDAGQGQR